MARLYGLTYHVPFGEDGIHAEILNEASKALV